MSLKSLLRKQSSKWQDLGATPAETITAITIYKRNILRRLIIKFLAFWALLGGGFYISITLFSEQSALAVVVAVIFSATAGLITNIFGTWRELDYSNLLLVLIQDANDEPNKSYYR